MPTVSLTIDIDIQSQIWRSNLPDIETITRTTMDEIIATLEEDIENISASEWEVSLVLSDDEFVRQLNRNYRNQDKSTNVLSFPQHQDPAARQSTETLALGDIVMAFETIQTEATEQNKALGDHFCHLLIHGFLHLLQYDHETQAEAEKMEGLEILILEKLNIKNPYQNL